MSHRVEGHLQLEISDYDRLIRQFVPSYEAMRVVHLELLALALPQGEGVVLDLGGGTGALAEAVLKRFPKVIVELWDIDPAMLAAARQRCAPFGSRIRFVERSFAEPLTPCDAVVACIALHHVKDLAVKGAIYRNIYTALKAGGMFLNTDAATPSEGRLRERAFARWTQELGEHGIGPEAAAGHFVQWAKEDFYPPLFTELSLLHQAGFPEPDCFWRQGYSAVFGAEKR
jgi:tRNA (cmo5U34)-methyltransferase